MIVRDMIVRDTIVSDRPNEPGFEVWLAKRSLRSRFMPGASVFPGGAVDAADDVPEARAATLDAGPAGAFALRHAALRELFEEAGVLLICTPAGAPASLGAEERHTMRAALHGRTATIDALLLARDLRLDARPLVPYSNWITPRVEPIRFDTHFYLALAPLDHDAEADAFELHDGRWSSPQRALDDADSGMILLTFPTRAHVERLAGFHATRALFAHAREREIAPLEIEMAAVLDRAAFERVVW